MEKPLLGWSSNYLRYDSKIFNCELSFWQGKDITGSKYEAILEKDAKEFPENWDSGIIREEKLSDTEIDSASDSSDSEWDRGMDFDDTHGITRF